MNVIDVLREISATNEIYTFKKRKNDIQKNELSIQLNG